FVRNRMHCTFSTKERYAFIDSDLNLQPSAKADSIIIPDVVPTDKSVGYFQSRPLKRTQSSFPTSSPPINRWAIFSRPLKRTQSSMTYVVPTDKSVGYFQSSAKADSIIIPDVVPTDKSVGYFQSSAKSGLNHHSRRGPHR